jgi:uncharacterized membrane protein YeaQ/YmgE (transglycosylase-associated protein family)
MLKMRELIQEFLREFAISLGSRLGERLGEILGGFIGACIGKFLYWLGQQGVYAYLRNIKELLKTYPFVGTDGPPFWTQLFTHPWVVPIMTFIWTVIGGIIGILIVKKLKKNK